MNILHIGNINNFKQSGVAVVVPKYLSAQLKHSDINCALYNLCSFKPNGEYPVYFGDDFTKFEPPFNKPDIIVFHEIYRIQFIKLYKLALKNKIPYIIIPHGSLTKTAQRLKKIKKLLGNILLFKKFIKNAEYIHFLSEYEHSESINFKYKNYFILGSGIDYPITTESSKKEKVLLYIGRLDIKVKGLDLLIKAVNIIQDDIRENGFRVELYGTSNGKNKEKMVKMIKKFSLEDILFVKDAVFDKEKIKIYMSSHAFIQFSRTEAQCLGLMEAMTYGLPVVVTEGTTFLNQVIENDLGLGVSYSPNDMASALKKIMIDDEMVLRKGNNAFEYIIKNYNWSEICNKQYKYYSKLVGDKSDNRCNNSGL